MGAYGGRKKKRYITQKSSHLQTFHPGFTAWLSAVKQQGSRLQPPQPAKPIYEHEEKKFLIFVSMALMSKRGTDQSNEKKEKRNRTQSGKHDWDETKRKNFQICKAARACLRGLDSVCWALLRSRPVSRRGNRDRLTSTYYPVPLNHDGGFSFVYHTRRPHQGLLNQAPFLSTSSATSFHSAVT